MLPFINPRLVAEFNDWPIGGGNRGFCKFAVEDNGKKGTRVSRTTMDLHGRICKPKYTTYHGKSAIVEGSDGRTYILQRVDIYNGIKVSRSDFMDAQLPDIGSSTVYRDSHPDLYNTFASLIEQAK